MTADLLGPGGVPDDDVRNAAAILGRRGGLVGGPACAAKLSPAVRRRNASHAARTRWRDHVPTGRRRRRRDSEGTP